LPDADAEHGRPVARPRRVCRGGRVPNRTAVVQLQRQGMQRIPPCGEALLRYASASIPIDTVGDWPVSDLEGVSPREGVIDARKVAGGVLLVIRAEDIRRTYSGLHAKVTVALAEVGSKSAPPILSDVMNIDKEDARHDFINKLYGIKG